ncbi:MAG: response regulator transcription factor [Candidatus Melainabacteria bacterium]|nr:response regulator transcription factor [Candidatus Melainabacteria bacterium]
MTDASNQTTNPAIRVLLVEDHQMTLMGLKLLLERDPFVQVVAEASDGVQALRLAEQYQPELVLMDIGLPEMDGVEATRQLKAQHPAIKILMLTSKDSEQDVFAALGAGADGYCMKGVSAEALSSAIRAVNEGTGWLDPAIARLVLGRFQGVGVDALQNHPQANGSAVVDKAALPVDCPLTAREMEVLGLIVDGYSNPEIADKLVITKATAKAHVHSILQKLCVDDRTQAAVLAMRQGFVKH